MKIEDLPDFPAIQELRRALWREGDLRGAAVMIGAGFSRNADAPSPTAKGAPLWKDLTAAMRFGLSGRLTIEQGEDPLQLAEEYSAVLGQASLNSLIRSELHDDELLPGLLHQRLLQLPWSDVLTTNFDSLLEKAASSTLGQSYDIVRQPADIARARSPRIVKLHGSAPAGPFIFTAEDYRTYPRMYAPFVNLVQQIILENHVVLLGFSATDPNFLAWTGWVRDHLGAAARRVHLIGPLSLSPGSKRVLEKRGIIPIDLSPLVVNVDNNTRHKEALEQLFDMLEQGKPPEPGEWKLSRYRAEDGLDANQFDGALPEKIEKLLSSWRSDRQQYPGWVVAPLSHRVMLQSAIRSDAIEDVVQKLSDYTASRAVYELLWRYDVALAPVPVALLRTAHRILKSEVPLRVLSIDERLQIAAWCLRAYRVRCDNEAFAELLDWCRPQSGGSEDVRASISYEAAAWTRDKLEYDKVQALTEEVGGTDPIFLLRRASLLMSIAAKKAAHDLITEALVRLRQLLARDRKSIWVISRYKWALFLARQAAADRSFGSAWLDGDDNKDEEAIQQRWKVAWSKVDTLDAENRWSDTSRNGCDPWSLLREFEDELREFERGRQRARGERRLLFDVGRYNVYQSIDKPEEPRPLGLVAAQAAHLIGLPDSIGSILIMGGIFERALLLSDRPKGPDLPAFVNLVRDDKVLDHHMSRAAVAALPVDSIHDVLDRLVRVVDYFSPYVEEATAFAAGRHRDDIERRIRLSVEIASRLVIRVDSTRALSMFKHALRWAHDARRRERWFGEALRNLVERSLEAMSDEDQGRILVEVVNFPLPKEVKATSRQEWPEPFDQFRLQRTLVRPANPSFAARIGDLIGVVATGEHADRIAATLRLLRLLHCGVVTSDERHKFVEAVWQRVDNFGLPISCDVYDRVFLTTLWPGDERAERALKRKLFKPGEAPTLTEDLVDVLSVEPDVRTGESKCLSLSLGEAISCLTTILGYAKRTNASNSFDRFYRGRTGNVLGYALANGVLPFIPNEALEGEMLDRLVAFLRVIPSASTNHVWPSLLNRFPKLEQVAVDCLRRGLLSQDEDEVIETLWAIDRWRRLYIAGRAPVPAPSVVSIILSTVALCRPAGLGQALQVSAQFIASSLLEKDQLLALIIALEVLERETRLAVHGDVVERPLLGDSIPTTYIRKEAARVALALSQVGITDPIVMKWLELIPVDPFPEVRQVSLDQ